ncbi:MAG: cellulase family glycosylhydrolase [Clostridia bacterium]|jgi:beta-galactosidase/beta-glucuronidase|nr:cellulase family glycosylhydrolase [Clostridia bacterium]
MGTKWSKERAWEWYNSRPWIRGCNYLPANCVNRIEMWQEYNHDKVYAVMEEEFKLMQEIGFNSIRVIIEFLVWDKEHDGYMERFEKFVQLADKHGITLMVVLANDCMRPKGFEVDKLGEQPCDWGYHGGRKMSQHGVFSNMGHHYLDEPETAPRFFAMIREFVEKYKNDERILIWNVYNEVGNSNRREVSLPNLKKIFEICREIDPIQPLTCETASYYGGNFDDVCEVEKYGVLNSDIISFHNYNSYMSNINTIRTLKKFGRPLINSEWLARCLNNNVEDLFPLYYLEKIGCYNWGLVGGKAQYYEPWNSVWTQYEENPNLKWDFTKWFHDLFRLNHRPYNPKEIEIIKKYSAMADEDFKEDKSKYDV